MISTELKIDPFGQIRLLVEAEFDGNRSWMCWFAFLFRQHFCNGGFNYCLVKSQSYTLWTFLILFSSVSIVDFEQVKLAGKVTFTFISTGLTNIDFAVKWFSNSFINTPSDFFAYL